MANAQAGRDGRRYGRQEAAAGARLPTTSASAVVALSEQIFEQHTNGAVIPPGVARLVRCRQVRGSADRYARGS